MSDIIYKAALYLRLSKEDGDKPESDSISNQRQLAMDFISRANDISLVCEMKDDGYTGSDFDRPAFKKMMDMVLNGDINCIIVKDLSRFARDYIGAGYYLERLFPALGVRFIAINDNIDYKSDSSSGTRLIMAFKNILNESYIRDISMKIRSQLEIKRRRGEYIGAFAVYGYMKSPDDRHKLIVDETAAETVKMIFRQRAAGISANAIANRLNLLGVPSPAEYKKLCGSNFSANFQRRYELKWSAKAVIRILTNEIYTGVLIQGKRTTVNYKSKKVIEKDRSEWSIVNNSHEPIIQVEQFNRVREIMQRDTRISQGRREPYLFSGTVICADCRAAMVRRKSASDNAVYMCSENKLGSGCSSHRVAEKVLYDTLIHIINTFCDMLSISFSDIGETSSESMLKKIRIVNESISKKQAAIDDLNRVLVLVEKDDEIYNDIKDAAVTLGNEIIQLRSERANIIREQMYIKSVLERLSEDGKIDRLDRVILLCLIDRIYVYEDKRIEITFRHGDKYSEYLKKEYKKE